MDSMSPGVTASSDTGNDTCTVCDCPWFSGTRAKPTRRRGGTTTGLTGWCTYTGTTAVPCRSPVLATVNVAVTGPRRETLPVTESPLVANVVYERPNPNGNSGL